MDSLVTPLPSIDYAPISDIHQLLSTSAIFPYQYHTAPSNRPSPKKMSRMLGADILTDISFFRLAFSCICTIHTSPAQDMPCALSLALSLSLLAVSEM